MICLRTSAPRWDSSSERSLRPASCSAASSLNDLPMTAAPLTIASSAESSRSSRAARTAWIVAGMGRPDVSCLRWDPSSSMRTSSSTNRGFPSALAATRSDEVRGNALVTDELLHERAAVGFAQRLHVDSPGAGQALGEIRS